MSDQVPDQLLDRLQETLAGLLQAMPNVRGVVIALSGGMDSMVLLDLCSRLQSEFPSFYPQLSWRVIHVNHGLHEDADHWQRHCLNACEQRSMSCQSFSLHLRNKLSSSSGEGLEAMARQARYQVIAENMQAHEVLLTAHHAQDQGETVLFRLLRGAGPRGLSGMQQAATVPGSPSYPLWRPLLGELPEDLRAYAASRASFGATSWTETRGGSGQMRWIEDSSNQDIAFSRNYLRHRVIPDIARRWPGWLSSVERSADICRDTEQLLQSLANQWLADCQGKQPGHLSVQGLLQHSQAERDVMLRQWLWLHCDQWAGKTVLEQLTSLLVAAEDRQPQLNWQNRVIRRYRDELLVTYKLPALSALPEGGYEWALAPASEPSRSSQPPQPQPPQPLVLPGNGRLLLEPVAQGGMRWPVAGSVVQVSYRQDGIKARLPGRPGKSLKQLWQEAGVPPWLRERSPLLYIGGELAWIAGIGVCDGFQAPAFEPGWLPRWEMPEE